MLSRVLFHIAHNAGTGTFAENNATSEKCQIYSNLETFKYSPEKNFGAYFHLPEIYKVSINRTLINVNLYLSNLLLLVCIKVLEETKNKKTKAQKNCPLCKKSKKDHHNFIYKRFISR